MASTPIPKLNGISTLGTRFCVYEYTPLSRSLTPLRIDSQPDFVTDVAPKERWNLVFLEPQGEVGLKQVVCHIKRWSPVSHVSLAFFDTASNEGLSESSFLKVKLSPSV